MSQPIEWRSVPGFEGIYEVSNHGEIVSLPRDYKYGTIKQRTILRPNLSKGYYRITLFKEGKRHRIPVHRIVASAFLNPIEGKHYINHKDENKLNNSADNLMWCTSKENSNWGTAREKISKAVSKPVSQYTKDGKFIKTFPSCTVAANEMNINLSCISDAVHHNKNAAGFKWRFTNEH